MPPVKMFMHAITTTINAKVAVLFKLLV